MDWISVKDRLPEEGGRTVLTWAGGGYELDCYDAALGGWMEAQAWDKAVTHWMPLPQPPMAPRSNAGTECDMEEGPCACGAWHTKGEVRHGR